MGEVKTVLASIILYNPDMERLAENIEAIKSQVKEIVMIVNGPGCEAAIEKYREQSGIAFVINDKNKGIAYALNQAMRYGYDNGYQWVLTLDQDSISPDNLVQHLSKHCDKENIGIIAPCNTDINKPSADLAKSGWEYLSRCITSASLTSIKAWKKVGGFTNELFIDYVDFDYCAKLTKNGYKIIKDYDIVLTHEVGHIKLLKLGKWEYPLYNHPPMRRYYYTRNMIYYYKTYPDIINVRWHKIDLLKRCIMVAIFEKQRVKKIGAMIRGAVDSRKLIKRMKNNK